MLLQVPVIVSGRSQTAGDIGAIATDCLFSTCAAMCKESGSCTAAVQWLLLNA